MSWTIGKLAKTVETVPGLTFGEIGSQKFEDGYDNGLYIIWVDGVLDFSGIAAKLWQCRAADFNSTAYVVASQKIQAFELGKQFVKQAGGQKADSNKKLYEATVVFEQYGKLMCKWYWTEHIIHGNGGNTLSLESEDGHSEAEVGACIQAWDDYIKIMDLY